MKTKNILTLALLPMIGMLAACSNDDVQTADRVPITLTGTTLTVEETRAAADTALNKGYLESGQAVRVRVKNTNASTWANYLYTSGTNGELTPPGTPPFYPLDGTHVDIVAYSPSSAGETFTIHSNQTSLEGYLASDLVFASAADKAKSNTAVPLQFEHKMAKIIITATAGAGVSTIEDVTLQNVLPEVAFNQSTGVVSSATGTAMSVAVVQNNTTSKGVGAAAIPAQAIDGNLLTVKTNLGTATYAVNSKVFNAGRVYKLNISVNRAAVNATTQITGWTDTASASVNKEEDCKIFTLVDENGGHVSFTMIRVEGGPYTTLAGKDVTGTLSSFYIGQLEVTNALWWMVMRSKPANQTNAGSAYPVTLVTYNDIMSSNGFIAKLNAQLTDQLDGMRFKLPTEAQWEYAARGGTNQERYTYSGGNTLDWYAVSKTYNDGKPMPCGSLYANSLGIYDMSGNAWEFCSDYYQTVASIPTNLGLDYAGPSSGSLYQLRGGGFANDVNLANFEGQNVNLQSISGTRWGWTATETNVHTGLRLALQ